MSLFGLLGDVGMAFFDVSMIQDGIQSARSHRWGHLPLDQVCTAVLSHARQAQSYTNQLEHMCPTLEAVQELRPDQAKEIRAKLATFLRENKFHQTVVAQKQQSIARKYPGKVGEERLSTVRPVAECLQREEAFLNKGLGNLNTYHATPKSQAYYHRLLDFGGTLQRQAYRHNIATGVLFASAVLLLPLYCAYSDAKGIEQTATQRSHPH